MDIRSYGMSANETTLRPSHNLKSVSLNEKKVLLILKCFILFGIMCFVLLLEIHIFVSEV